AIDIRLIAATHRNLENLVAEEKFRSDLFYRLNVARIHLPPLRQRLADIPALAMHFLRQLKLANRSRIQGFAPDAMQCLMEHTWPGNIRELRNAIEAAVLVCESDQISEQDLRRLQFSLMNTPPPMKTTIAPTLSTIHVEPEPDR